MVRFVEEDVRGFDVAVDDAVLVCSGQGTAHLACEGARLLHIEWTIVETPFECAAAKPPHDQIRRVWISPEVDQRNDVGMFDSGDEVGFGLEASNEFRTGSKIRPDLFDRNLTIY